MPFGFGDSAPAPAAGAPQAAPVDPFKPSALDVALGVLFNGQAPAEAAMQLRQRKAADYQNQIVMQAMAGALQNATPEEQRAMIFNPQEYGKAMSDRFATHAVNGGQTLVNGGPGGAPFTATTYGVDNSTPYALGPNVPGGFQSGPQMAGKTEVDPASGVFYNNQGPTGARAGRPQLVPLGSSLQDFQGSVSGAMPMAGAQGQTAPQPAAQGGQNAPMDGAGFFRSFILPHEGGLNPSDMNGSPTKYGINQAANPDVDVHKLTPQGAEQIFMNKYWAKSGAANMPAPLAAVHADTYYINPKMAGTFLEQSGGDPNKYLDLRESWMARMAQNNPKAAVYAGAWSRRNADLQSFIDASGGAQPQAQQPGSLPAQVSPLTQARGVRTLSPQEAQAGGFAPGAVVEEDALGHRSVAQPPEYGPEAKSKLRGDVLNSDEYKQANAAMSAYKSMIANAKTMTGPSAYAMLDTFARAINPGAVARPQVIQTIEQNLGIPAQLVGRLQSMAGQGNLPPQVRQQIIDAVVPFAQAHWDQANHLNQANSDLARQHGFDAADVTAPLDGRPQGVSIAALEAGIPAPGERVSGKIYPTPRGPMKWTGTGWKPAGAR